MDFYKISKEQFKKDFEGLPVDYDDIKLPERATEFSAGYDFFSPISFRLDPSQSIKIPSGIRIKLDNDKCLKIYPRSGLGFKYRCQLDNTVGIIDADYFSSDNEGHIWIKLTNDTHQSKIINIAAGEAICQGIIEQYFLVDHDVKNGQRNGGFGSTTKKKTIKQKATEPQPQYEQLTMDI